MYGSFKIHNDRYWPELWRIKSRNTKERKISGIFANPAIVQVISLRPLMPFIIMLQQLIASSTHLFAKSITTVLHPAHVVFFRGGFSMLAYALWMLIRRRKLPAIDKKDWPWIFLLGALNMPINQLLFIWGIRYTTPANASLAYALTPAFVLVIAVLTLGEKLTKTKLTGILLAIAGTVIVLFEKGFAFGSEQFTGNIMVLAASLAWAFYTTLGRRFAVKYGAIYSTGLSMITGIILYTPLVALLPFPFEIDILTPFNWFQLFYLGVITSGLGYALWYYALSKIEASKLAVFNNVQPLLTTIFSFYIFGTEPGMLFICGGLIAIAGVIITQRG